MRSTQSIVRRVPAILYVESSDVAAVFRQCTQSSTEFEYDIRSFSTQEAALTALRETAATLAFCDGSSGQAIIHSIKSANVTAPIILLIDRANNDLVLSHLRQGADDVLVKETLSPLILDKCVISAMDKLHLRLEQRKLLSALSEQRTVNDLKSRLWKIAFDKTLPEKDLIAATVRLLGPALHLSRVEYYRFHIDGAVCVNGWCPDCVDSELGNMLSLTAVGLLYGREYTEISETALLPEEWGILRPFTSQYHIRSALAAPIGKLEAPDGYLVCEDCEKERHWSEAEISVIVEATRVISARFTESEIQRERSSMDQQFRVSQKMEAVGQLAGGIAHDFNNILGAVAGYAEMINRKFGALDPKLEKYSASIISAARRAADLTSKLLAFARRGKYQAVKINVHDAVNEVVRILHQTISEKISVEKTLEAPNPAVIGDPTQIQNALLNIAFNARDALPDGGTISFHTENITLDERFMKSHTYSVKAGRYFLLTIADNGVGMESAVRERIFEPFFTTKEVGKGSGLGLASVYGTVKAHDGYVDVETDLGKGSIFKIYLPVGAGPESTLTTELRSNGVNSTKGMIMVIDDEDFILDICFELLKELGFSCITFKNSAEAVTWYEEHFPEVDLILIDMIMPILNGRNCFRKLKAVNPRIKAVLSTGYSFNQEAQAIMDDGVQGFIQKPFDSAQLEKVIDDVLKK